MLKLSSHLSESPKLLGHDIQEGDSEDVEGDGIDPVGKLLLVVAGVVHLQGHREDDPSHEHLRPLHRVLSVHV